MHLPVWKLNAFCLNCEIEKVENVEYSHMCDFSRRHSMPECVCMLNGASIILLRHQQQKPKKRRKKNEILCISYIASPFRQVPLEATLLSPINTQRDSNSMIALSAQCTVAHNHIQVAIMDVDRKHIVDAQCCIWIWHMNEQFCDAHIWIWKELENKAGYAFEMFLKEIERNSWCASFYFRWIFSSFSMLEDSFRILVFFFARWTLKVWDLDYRLPESDCHRIIKILLWSIHSVMREHTK